MFISNLLRSIVFSIAAAFLIFSQDHSVPLGATVLLAVAAANGFIGLALLPRKEFKDNVALTLFMSAVSLTIGMFLLTTNGFIGLQNTQADLVAFRTCVAVFVLSLAVAEFIQSGKAAAGDRLEYRISAAIAVITALIFALAPLNDVNAVGFLSAYLAISAVQRAIWIATDGKQVRNGKK